MRVDELKGKSVLQRESYLKNKNLETEIVDKLSKDRSESVRHSAFVHKNISQKALLAASKAKRNQKDDFSMGIIFDQLTPKNLLLLFQKDYHKKIRNIMIDSNWIEVVNSFRKKTDLRNELLEILIRDIYDSSYEQPKSFVSYVLRNYPVKDDRKLFDFLKTHYPNKLLIHKDNVGLTKKEETQLLDKFVKNKNRFSSPHFDLGEDYVRTADTKSLTKLIKSYLKADHRFMDDVFRNKNVNASHTEILISRLDRSNVKELIKLFSSAPLNKKIEKKIIEFIKTEVNFMGSVVGWSWKLFEAWTKNPDHSADLAKDEFLKEFRKDGAWSVDAIKNMIDSGKYSLEDIEELVENPSSDASESDLSTYLYFVSSNKFPKRKLKELWDKYWNGQTIYDSDQRNINLRLTADTKEEKEEKINDLLHEILVNSNISEEVSAEYYQETGDERYLPKDIKDIFFF